MLPLALMVRVLVMTPESTTPPDGFVEALGIQLAGVGVVEAGPAVPNADLAKQALAAARAVDSQGAALAVWVVSETDSRYRLNVVGRRNQRLFIERLALTAPTGPDLARTLALKVGAVLDSLIRNPNRSVGGTVTWVPEATTGASAGATTPPTVAAPSRAPRRPDRTVRGFVELGARGTGGASAPGTQAAGELAGGARLAGGALELDGYLAIRYDTGLSLDTPAGSVDTTELATAAGARALWPVGGLAIGGQLELGVRRIGIDGATPAGTAGSTDVVVPTVATAAVASTPVSSWFAIKLAAGVETASIARTLTINEIDAVRLGRSRAFAEITAVILVP